MWTGGLHDHWILVADTNGISVVVLVLKFMISDQSSVLVLKAVFGLDQSSALFWPEVTLFGSQA